MDKKSVLDNPEILRRETALGRPIRKKKGWMFKLILILIILAVIYYLFTHPALIRDPVNRFFSGFR